MRRRNIVDEQLGLQLLVEPFRWRVTTRSDCPPDVRAALAEGEPWEGPAQDERDAYQRGLIALGMVRGWVLARRRGEQPHLFGALHVDRPRETVWQLMRATIEAVYLALERGWPWVAAAIVVRSRAKISETFGLLSSTETMARTLVAGTSAELRKRGLPQ